MIIKIEKNTRELAEQIGLVLKKATRNNYALNIYGKSSKIVFCGSLDMCFENLASGYLKEKFNISTIFQFFEQTHIDIVMLRA